jgi:hypothetical protein
VLLTSQHVMLSSFDVRAEPYLVGMVTGAVFHTVSMHQPSWRWHALAASGLTAMAIMTKGPFVLLPVASAALGPALMRAQPLHVGRFVVALGLTAVFALPEVYCVWTQFDLHPEKTVFGQTGVSGVRFFLWDSQFSRFMNNGPIRGKGSPLFFLHTLLWAFLPWSFALLVAVFTQFKKLFQLNPLPWCVTGPTFLLFSASRFQLPHYLNILFPFWALVVATSWVHFPPHRWLHGIQAALCMGVFIFTACLLYAFKVPIPAVLMLTVALALWFRKSMVAFSVITTVGTHAALLIGLAPTLLDFQGGRAAARLANELSPLRTALVEVRSETFAFHLTQPPAWWSADEARHQARHGPFRTLMTATQFEAFVGEGFVMRELKRFSHFHVSRPTATFLSPASREESLETWVLGEMAQPSPE